MSWLSKAFSKLFHKSGQSSQPVVSERQSATFMNWRSKEKEYIAAAELRLKNWIVDTIQRNNGLEFTWESGNDESFLEFMTYKEEEQDKYADLEMYLTYKLDIPDAGEFEMTGQGKLYIQNNIVFADYSSELRELVDFNEETEEVYGEAEKETNNKELFSW